MIPLISERLPGFLTRATFPAGRHIHFETWQNPARSGHSPRTNSQSLYVLLPIYDSGKSRQNAAK
jgi:hypothetical protein